MGKWGFYKGCRDNWFSNPLYNWIDSSRLPRRTGMEKRCEPGRLRKVLAAWSDIMPVSVEFYPDGTYEEPGKPKLTNIPAFYLVRIREIITDSHVANVRIMLPVRWNGSLVGIAGAGSNLETDWDKEQTTNITSWPMAVRNGFACFVNNGATGMFVDAGWGFKDGDLDWPLIDYWALYGTHHMTQVAKAVAEAAYGEPAGTCYMHGTSGGARQILVEAQKFPADYDGLWADGPMTDYYNLMFSCLWAALVFYREPHKVPLSKYKAVKQFFRRPENRISEPFSLGNAAWEDFLRKLPGLSTGAGPITQEDLRVMRKVWNGPVLSDGSRITYGFGPEITQWPVGPRHFGYLRIKENGQPSLIPFALQWLRWLVRDPEWDLPSCSYEEWEHIYRSHVDEFAAYRAYDPDLRPMAAQGAKLMITHGTADHISPNQLTRDYYRKALSFFPSEPQMNRNFRVFLLENAGHALYDWDGPNVTNASGWKALMRWVEKGEAPTVLETARYDFGKDRLLEKGQSYVYSQTARRIEGLECRTNI